MKEYIEKVMHYKVDALPYGTPEKLPLICSTAFILTIMSADGQEFLMAEPVENMGLTELRKMRIQLERYTGYRCVFGLKNVNWYAAPKMVEEGIPFIWENHQIYLPFMGMYLSGKGQRTPKNCTVISFLTQKLLLKALYENWQDVSAVKAAELLQVTRMSVTRCYDEIEALGMPFLKTQKKSRRFYASENKKEMWETILPFLRNPVIRTFRPETKPDCEMLLAGISALAKYSMLNDDPVVTYAVRKEQVGDTGLKCIREVPENEDPACIVYEVGYIIPYGDNKAVDPLSVALMMSEKELSDPRVKMCVDEMMEQILSSDLSQ